MIMQGSHRQGKSGNLNKFEKSRNFINVPAISHKRHHCKHCACKDHYDHCFITETSNFSCRVFIYKIVSIRALITADMEYYNVVTNYTCRLTFMWLGKLKTTV